MTSGTLHKVFVYGTLKKGEPNHDSFLKDEPGYHKFLYEAITCQKFPLFVGTQYNMPIILHSPGTGHHIKGEVYEVDEKVLEKLDILEEHPKYYIRDLYDIKPLASNEPETKAWIYMIRDFKPELLNQTFYESYSNSYFSSQGKEYIERYLRNNTIDHRACILANYPQK
nr:unnamed protein product [Callosobruchus chinensis]CAH7751901.1 unnamed protein product [Callosobruchus chinensis]